MRTTRGLKSTSVHLLIFRLQWADITFVSLKVRMNTSQEITVCDFQPHDLLPVLYVFTQGLRLACQAWLWMHSYAQTHTFPFVQNHLIPWTDAFVSGSTPNDIQNLNKDIEHFFVELIFFAQALFIIYTWAHYEKETGIVLSLLFKNMHKKEAFYGFRNPPHPYDKVLKVCLVFS